MEQIVQIGLLLFLLLTALWAGWQGYYPSVRSVRDPIAEARARALLAEMLSERERKQMAECGYLSVPSRIVQGRTYRIPSDPGWVEVYEDGRLAMKLCVEPVQPLPTADVVLMHKLMIEGSEQSYVKTANVVFLSTPHRSAWGGRLL